ncbi:hypothetical protein BZA77DRAFT_385526 [Pyronema omphalodes]|nr:hypothetical protein BZA77DRAFT_385526 [Pyronema omphalodes]
MAYYTRPPIDPERDILPTYEDAVARDPIGIIARYIRKEDMFSAAVVSRNWNRAITPVLWESPHTFWGMGERTELTCFQLFLAAVTKSDRKFPDTTHLSLVSIRSTLYTSISPKWLCTILTQLPNLRVLNVGSFPFFDHSALSTTGYLQSHWSLQELSACSHNATASGLCTLLSRLPCLTTLDLTSCSGANIAIHAINAISSLHKLRTISLRDLKLDDDGISTLLKTCGTRIKSLDLRGNFLTDKTANMLLDHCFTPPSYMRLGAVLEDGLTHLRIADNFITPTGAAKLIRSGKLVKLDVGDVTVETSVLSMYAYESLQTLRAGYKTVMRKGGIRRRMLPALKTLILTEVPEWGDYEESAALVEFITMTQQQEGDSLKVLELEVNTGGDSTGDFSFFEDHNTGKIATLEAIRKLREARKCWEGRIRVVRNHGGKECMETGVEGERWGLVREDV